MSSKLAVLFTLSAGCYAELGGGYMPSAHDNATSTVASVPPTTTTTTTATSGWSVSFNIGFYLDAPIPLPVPYIPPAIGLGFAPISENALVAGDGAPRSNTGGYEGRLDLTLPIDTGDILSFRVTGTYGKSSSAGIKERGQADYTDADAKGSEWFLGATVGGRNELGGLFQLSLGLQHQHSTSVEKAASQGGLPSYDISATGFAMRFMIAWTPEGALFRNGYQYKPTKEQRHNDCHLVTTTNSDHVTTTHTECF